MLPGASPAIDEQDIATINRFATWVGGDATSIKTRVVAAGIDAVVENKGRRYYRIADLFSAFSTENQFQRRARVQADEIELRVRQRRGEVVPALELEQELAGVLKIAVEFFDTLPDILERDCGATPQQLERIEQTVDEVREAMYERLSAAGEGDDVVEEPAEAFREKRVKQPADSDAKRQVTAPREPTTADAAADFLIVALREGPRAAAELIAEAQAAGISETSLRRAKAKMPIAAKRAGKGWAWSLEGDQDSQAG